jgi:hypothetical protein
LEAVQSFDHDVVMHGTFMMPGATLVGCCGEVFDVADESLTVTVLPQFAILWRTR